jgi:hypothetical protein
MFGSGISGGYSYTVLIIDSSISKGFSNLKSANLCAPSFNDLFVYFVGADVGLVPPSEPVNFPVNSKLA